MLHVTTLKEPFMASNSAPRVQKHRLSLRASGLRPIQIWVPDTHAPGFLEECRRQSKVVAIADKADFELMSFLDSTLSDLNEL
jgi:hypothetical protein